MAVRRRKLVAGRGDRADTAPVGVDAVEHLSQGLLRPSIAGRSDDARIAVGQRRPARLNLIHTVEQRRQQAFGMEPRHRYRQLELLGHKAPFIATHHRGDMAGGDQGVEGGLPAG